MQQPALVRQADPPGTAQEQRRAEPFLQRRDLVADGGWGNAELVGSALEAAVSRGDLESAQGVQRRHLSGERRPLRHTLQPQRDEFFSS